MLKSNLSNLTKEKGIGGKIMEYFCITMILLAAAVFYAGKTLFLTIKYHGLGKGDELFSLKSLGYFILCSTGAFLIIFTKAINYYEEAFGFLVVGIILAVLLGGLLGHYLGQNAEKRDKRKNR